MNILDHDALDLSALLERKILSAAELMQATLERVDAVNPQINAIVSLRDPDALMTEARRADQSPRRGWMHGLPLAIKDLANVAGLPTSMGSPIFKDQIASQDDLMVARLRQAGALIIGKTNTPEFGLGSHSFNPVYGTTVNPYDPSCSAGGSSGGAGAALATRMLSIADGSDMMGSLRNPAAWNNVYGFRPTWARVPTEPMGDSFLHQLSTLGPMARSPRDIAALLDTQSGSDSRQPHVAPDITAVLPQIDADVTGRRIGWLGNWGGAYPMASDLLDATQKSLTYFTDIGCVVEELVPPFSSDALWDSWITLRSWAIAGALAPLCERHRTLLKPPAIWEIERGLELSAMAVHRASVTRSNWFKKTAELFEMYDALLLPTTQVWPFPAEWDWPKDINGTTMDTYHRWMEIVVPVSLIGLPCLNIPAGFGPQGLPFGLQLFGPRNRDASLLQIGQAWHKATRWPDRQPDQILAVQ